MQPNVVRPQVIASVPLDCDFNTIKDQSAPSFSNSSLNFSRGSFAKNGRVHIESCCNLCCFRIAASTYEDFDNEARACCQLRGIANGVDFQAPRGGAKSIPLPIGNASDKPREVHHG
jgi:hypothetical protein